MRLTKIQDSKPYVMRWADVVRQKMKEKGWNQKKLATELGKSPQFISQLLHGYEHGKRRPVLPSVEIIMDCDQKLGVSKEQQYQALGLTTGFNGDHRFGLVPLQSLQAELDDITTYNRVRYDQRMEQDREQRLQQLEEAFSRLERYFGFPPGGLMQADIEHVREDVPHNEIHEEAI